MEFTIFETDLQSTLGVVKYTKDIKALKHYIRDASEVKKEGNNVCKALDDLYEEGIEKGIEAGLEQGNCQTVINLISKGKLSLEDGAEELGISVEDLKLKMA